MSATTTPGTCARSRGDAPELTAEQQARLEEIEAEIEAANEAWEDADEDGQVEQANRVEMLEAEYRAIEKPVPIISEEQKAGALAYVVIGHDGQPRLHEQLYVAPVDEPDDEEQDEQAEGEVDNDDVVATTGRSAYSQRLSLELAEMKSRIAARSYRQRSALRPRSRNVLDGRQGDPAFQRFSTLRPNSRPISPSPGSPAHQSGTLAAEEWGKIDEALDRSWTEAGDACQRYDAFCALPDEVRAAWLAWAIARTLHAVVAGKTGEAMIDHLGTKLEIDVAAWWRPTANNYFDRLSSKAAILTHLEEIGGKELSSRYGASKKHDLATSAEKIFGGSVPIEAELREAALAWVPDVMRFSVPAIAPEPVARK